MLESIRRRLDSLKKSTCGNATILVATGLPALIGASGLAVDSAQYYMWKRELQFAVDQAALAGAWAKSDSASAANYSARAVQEYNTNMQIAGSFDTAPTVSTVSYNGGTNNAVKVISSATKALPFTDIVIGRSITVSVTATAMFEAGVAGTSITTTTPGVSACMVALHPTANGALTIGGSASGTVACGGATLSADANGAIRENGNPNAQFGSLAATGGIEATLLDNVGNDPARLRANQAGLANPFGSMANPTGNGIARTYSCPAVSGGTTTTTANVTTTTKVEYRYYTGANTNTTTLTSPTPTSDNAATSGWIANPADTTSGPTSQTVTNGTTNGTVVGSFVVGSYVLLGGSGNSKRYRVPFTRVDKTYTNVNVVTTGGSDGVARPLPGTYSNIAINCQTEFSPGIYVINGAMDFSNNKVVTGSDVMFVFTSANNVSNINANTSITLSGITANTLMSTYGYSNANATKLAGMLFWDPYSTSEIKWNGNSQTIYNGALYMPNRPLWFNGTASVSGRCMMLIASTLMFTGNISLSSFCQTGGSGNFSLRDTTTTTTTTAGTAPVVKLVV